jgi:hypothetical protein
MSAFFRDVTAYRLPSLLYLIAALPQFAILVRSNLGYCHTAKGYLLGLRLNSRTEFFRLPFGYARIRSSFSPAQIARQAGAQEP